MVQISPRACALVWALSLPALAGSCSIVTPAYKYGATSVIEDDDVTIVEDDAILKGDAIEVSTIEIVPRPRPSLLRACVAPSATVPVLSMCLFSLLIFLRGQFPPPNHATNNN